MMIQEQQQQKRKREKEKERGEHTTSASSNDKNDDKNRNRSKDDRSMKEVKALGEQLLTSRAHINNLPLLLAYVSPSSPPHYALESLLSLQSFFTPLLPNLPSPTYKSLSSSISLGDAAAAPQEDPQVIYGIWVRSKFDAFIDSLLQLSISPLSQPTLRDIAVDSIMEFVKLGNGGAFQSSIYHKFLRTLVHSSSPVDFLLESFASKYFKFLDVRYFTYISLARLAETLEAKDNIALTLDVDAESHSRAGEDLSIQKLHYILSHIPPVEALDDKLCHDMWTVSGNSEEHLQPPRSKGKQKKAEEFNSNGLSSTSIAKKMKRKFTKAWITFLRLPLPLDVYKEVLVSLPQLVIPHLSNPIMLCDFLTRSYDIGGVISVMSLSSLYILMTQHGLEYPNFYEKLYALLVPSIFLAKHRAKFFQLLDSCLKSSLIPAYLAAAFTKKLSRMSLSISPSGDLVVVALIHNLLRRHPSINCLVHWENGGETVNAVGDADISTRRLGIDNFKDDERDPMKSNAMRSSLWEIDTLRHHYCPPVSRFVLSLEEDLTIRAKTTEVTVSDFCSGSYATIFREEIRRRIKQVPLAFYREAPDMLFSETEFAGWTFKCEEGREGNALDDGNIPTSASEGRDHNSAKRQRVEMNLS